MNFLDLAKQASSISTTLVLVLLVVCRVEAQNCSNTSVGFVPLNGLGTGAYLGFQGGLYPGGSNEIPSAHLVAGLELAQQVEPLNSAGVPDPVNGKHVFLSIGMSNTTQEFREFLKMVDADPEKNPQLVVVDGAQGGWDAAMISDPAADFWNRIDTQRLPNRGVTPQQVQVVWLKEADRRPTLPFPQDAQKLQGELLKIVQIIKSRYPNTKIVYLSSRTYAGYATTPLNPEPFAYQSGFAVKWLIQQQIEGDPELNFDPANGEVKAPWLAWGPYLWTDGVGPDGVEGGIPGRSDGLEWTCSDQDLDGDGFPDGDVNWDGTHPAIKGRIKVANLLMDFVKSDTTARIWYLAESTPTDVKETDDETKPERFLLY